MEAQHDLEDTFHMTLNNGTCRGEDWGLVEDRVEEELEI